MAELVDALGSGPSVFTDIGVQVSFRVFSLIYDYKQLYSPAIRAPKTQIQTIGIHIGN